MLKVQSLIIQIVNKEESQAKICVKVRNCLGDLYIIQRTTKTLKKVKNLSHEAIQNSNLLCANKM